MDDEKEFLTEAELPELWGEDAGETDAGETDAGGEPPLAYGVMAEEEPAGDEGNEDSAGPVGNGPDRSGNEDSSGPAGNGPDRSEKAGPAEDAGPAASEDAGRAASEDAAERDWRGEAEAFFAARPELAGRELPERVVRRWAAGESLARAFDGAERDELRAETERLRRENEALRQNAAAAARAPVRGVTGGGAADNAPLDPFLEGLRYE
jgi:hypothetical protein